MSAGLAVATVASLVLAAGAVVRRAADAGWRRPADRSFGEPAIAWRSAFVDPLARRIGVGSPRDQGEPIHLLRLRTELERGGSTLQAFQAVAAGDGRWAAAAQRVARRVRAGASVQDAVDQWMAEEPEPSVVLVADALAIAGATGGSQVRAIDAVIDAVRERSALFREVRALASQARASAVVLVVMPVGFAVAVAALDPRVRAFYLGSPLGWSCVVIGIGLDVAGAWWMARLVARVS